MSADSKTVLTSMNEYETATARLEETPKASPEGPPEPDPAPAAASAGLAAYVAPPGTHPETCPVPGSHTRTSCNFFREQLARYGRHLPGCTEAPPDCSCGLRQAVEGRAFASTPLPEKPSESRAASAGLESATLGTVEQRKPDEALHALVIYCWKNCPTEGPHEFGCYEMREVFLRAASAGEGALRAALAELLRLYDWRFQIAEREKLAERNALSDDFQSETRRQLRQYGAEKKAAWEAARAALAQEQPPAGPSKAVESGAALAPAQRETEKEQK